MDAGRILLLAVQGVVFVAWAVLMFRTLFRLRAIASERRAASGGGFLAGFGHTLQTFRDFAVRPVHRRDRRRLILLTLLMFALIAGNLLLIPAAPA